MKIKIATFILISFYTALLIKGRWGGLYEKNEQRRICKKSNARQI